MLLPWIHLNDGMQAFIEALIGKLVALDITSDFNENFKMTILTKKGVPLDQQRMIPEGIELVFCFFKYVYLYI